MTCPSCLSKIERAVASLDGTDQIKVLFNAGKLKFILDSDKTKAADVKAAVEKMGYEVQGLKEGKLNQ